MRTRGLGVGLLIVAGSLSPAAADVTRCATTEADLRYQDRAFSAHNGDTGWFPSASPAQLRITGRIAGETTVAMGLDPTACWSAGMALGLPGRAGAGLLDFAYGAEVNVFGQVHTRVLGNAIDWEGEIPVPLSDLLLASSTSFTPGAAATASAHDTTSPITVLSTNVIGDYIGITGISGGLRLQVTGAMTTTYRTTALTTDVGDLVTDGARLPIAAPAAGFGRAIDLSLGATGRLTYAPSLIFTVSLDIKILGIRVVDWQLASVPMALPVISREVALTSDGIHLALPHATPLAGARFDFAAGATQRLAIHNDGEAPLMIVPLAAPAGVTAAAVTIAPGADGFLEVTATDDAVTAGPALLGLVTNDPNQPTVEVALGRELGGTGTDEPVGVEHGGCDAGAGSAGLLIGLAALGLRRRRSTTAPRRA